MGRLPSLVKGRDRILRKQGLSLLEERKRDRKSMARGGCMDLQTMRGGGPTCMGRGGKKFKSISCLEGVNGSSRHGGGISNFLSGGKRGKEKS